MLDSFEVKSVARH